MKPPDNIASVATAHGFEIPGWDEECGALKGNGHEYVGTHDEIAAYLHAWEMCKTVQAYATADEIAKGDAGTIARTMIVLRSSMTIQPGQLFQVTARPQAGQFRGERIAIRDGIAGHFEINDLKVGNRSCMPTSQTINGAMFATRIDAQAKILVVDHGAGVRVSITEAALAEWGRRFTMPTCQVAMDICVTATLRDEAPPTEFEMLIIGKGIGV